MKILIVYRVGVSLRTAARRQTKSSTRGPFENREGSSERARETDRHAHTKREREREE